MNWYEKHLGDWAKKTGHLSMLEEGAYNRLCDWCYIHERPLPLTEREVCKVARAATPTERAATRRVLHEFFTLATDGWHQGRIDKLLRAYETRVSQAVNNPASPAQRAARYRARRAELFKQLNAVGLNAPFSTPNGELERMLTEAGHEVTSGQTSRTNVTPASRDEAAFVTEPQQPTTIPLRDGVPAATSKSAAATAPESARELLDFAAAAKAAAAANGIVDPTVTGRAAKAIKAAGFGLANTADPRFLALVNAGVTDDEWRLTAAEAVARGKGWGWLLATLAGRREDVAKGYVAIPSPRAANRRESIEALTPTAAAKSPPF